MIKSFYNQVASFSKAFGVRQYEMLSFVPSEVLHFRVKLIEEEEKEYETAKTPVETLDAICDLFYVVLGAAYVTNTSIRDLSPCAGRVSLDISDEVTDVIDELLAPIPCQKRLPNFFNALNKRLLNISAAKGFKIEPAFNEVHRSNLAKFWSQTEALTRPNGWIMERIENTTLYRVKDTTDKVRKPPSWTAPNLTPYV